MCGISGIFMHQDKDLCKHKIESANKLIEYRGPDDDGIYIDEYIGLGHVRLSIIDLSKDGQQPFRIGDKIIVFNGEIYNYLELKEELQAKGILFRTKTDTEVLLQSFIVWGEKCLQKLNGMFAFAIWDTTSRSLFCARDRVGIKPFYYTKKDRKFCFSSEIKSTMLLSNVRSSPNIDVIGKYLLQGLYGYEDKTFFENIFLLEPSHYMWVKENSIRKYRYWDIEYQDKSDQAEEEFFNVLNDSVRLRFRSDVPVGVNVSGGLDSSVLISAIDKTLDSKSMEAYTYTCDHEDYDEVPYVKILLSGKPYNWNISHFSPSDFYDTAMNMQYYLEEPFGGLPTLAYSNIFQDAKCNSTKVLLAGEGMDEQWCGYSYYSNCLGADQTSVVQGTNTALMPSVVNRDIIDNYTKFEYDDKFKSPIDNVRYRDIFYTKIQRSLRYSDRISMARSIELRVPFLDHRLIEIAFRLPISSCLRNGETKYGLRQYAKKFVDPRIIDAPKRPLQTPQREWLRSSGWVFDILNSQSFRDRNIFDIPKIKGVYNRYLGGEFDNSFFLWQWLNLEMWFRTFID